MQIHVYSSIHSILTCNDFNFSQSFCHDRNYISVPHRLAALKCLSFQRLQLGRLPVCSIQCCLQVGCMIMKSNTVSLCVVLMILVNVMNILYKVVDLGRAEKTVKYHLGFPGDVQNIVLFCIGEIESAMLLFHVGFLSHLPFGILGC